MSFLGKEKTNSTMIIPPEDARVYNMAGGGEGRLLLTGDKTGGAWMGRFREDPDFMTQFALPCKDGRTSLRSGRNSFRLRR
jgi:hypothetical protein